MLETVRTNSVVRKNSGSILYSFPLDSFITQEKKNVRQKKEHGFSIQETEVQIPTLSLPSNISRHVTSVYSFH